MNNSERSETSKTYRFRVLETTDIHAYIEDYDYYTDNPINQGLVYVKTAADQARQELLDLGYPEESILVVDVGDLIQGSPLGNFLVEEAYTPGEEFGTGTWSVDGAETTNVMPIYGSLNFLGVDASALGNHEFNFGLDYLYSSIANLGDVPVLSGNIFNDPDNTFGGTPDEHSFQPYELFDVQAYNSETGEIEEVTIGVAGFTTEGIMGFDAKHLVGEVYTEKVTEMAAELALEMRAAGADLLFGLTHTDHGDEDDPALAEYEHDTSLGVAKVDTDGDGEPDYDALFGGHEHQRSNATPVSELDVDTEPDTFIGYAEPFTDFTGGIPSELNGVPFLMSGSWGDTLGVMDIFITKDAEGNWDVADYAVSFIDIKGLDEEGQEVPLFEADPELREYIEPWHEGTIEYMGQPVAEISTAMSSYFAHGFDDPLLETFAEIQIEYGQEVLNEMFTNEGLTIEAEDLPILSVATGYKGGREGGTDYTVITAPEMLNRDIANMYIYDNNVASIVVLNGAELEDYLEYSAFQAYNTIDPDSSEPQVLNKVPEFSRGYNVDVVKGRDGALTYDIDVTQEPEFDENGATGNEGRIINLEYQGEPVEDDDTFFLVMNNYRSNGGGNYPIDWAQKDADGLLYLSPDENQKVFADYFAAAEGVVDTGLPNGEPTFRPVVSGDQPVEVVYIGSNNEDAQSVYAPLVGAEYIGEYENDQGENDINGKGGFANYNVTLEPSESDSIVGDVIPLTLDQVRGGQPALGKDQIRYKLGRFNGVNWPEGVDEEINGLLQPGRFFSDDQKMFEDVAEANGRSTDDVVRSDNSTPKDPNSFEARDPVGTNTGDMKTVVLGPDGGYYLTDGHHTSNVFVGLDRGGLEDFTLNFVVQDDFSDLTDENGNGSAMDEFWVEMANNGYGWLKILNEDENRYDYMPGVTGVDDEYRVTAVDLDVFEMPAEMGIDNFANDPYRSIAYFTREIGWNKPSDTPAEGLPFVEFYWAEEIQDAIQAGNTDLDLSQYDLTDLSSYLEVIEITAEWMVSLDANELIGTSSFTAQEMGQLESFNPDGVLETLVDASEPDESGEATKFLKVEDSDEADAADIGDLPRPGKLAYAWADQFGDLPVIEGTDDDDEIVGSESDVRIFAKAGNDTVAGGLGNDEIYGEADNDILRGDLNTSDPQGNIEGGNDTIFGGSGDDNIGGKAGDDQLYGDEGNDEIWGDDGDDLLRGGLGDDILTGDDFSGGSGADTFILAVGEGTDTITDFEIGIDVIGLEGLTFADLSLSGNAIAVDDETLAIVEGLDTTTLTEDDFISV